MQEYDEKSEKLHTSIKRSKVCQENDFRSENSNTNFRAKGIKYFGPCSRENGRNSYFECYMKLRRISKG